jgi:hypothetical protein
MGASIESYQRRVGVVWVLHRMNGISRRFKREVYGDCTAVACGSLYRSFWQCNFTAQLACVAIVSRLHERCVRAVCEVHGRFMGAALDLYGVVRALCGNCMGVTACVWQLYGCCMGGAWE